MARNHLALGFRDHVSSFIGPVAISFLLRGQSPGATPSGPTDADAPDTHTVDPWVGKLKKMLLAHAEITADDEDEDEARR